MLLATLAVDRPTVCVSEEEEGAEAASGLAKAESLTCLKPQTPEEGIPMTNRADLRSRPLHRFMRPRPVGDHEHPVVTSARAVGPNCIGCQSWGADVMVAFGTDYDGGIQHHDFFINRDQAAGLQRDLHRSLKSEDDDQGTVIDLDIDSDGRWGPAGVEAPPTPNAMTPALALVQAHPNLEGLLQDMREAASRAADANMNIEDGAVEITRAVEAYLDGHFDSDGSWESLRDNLDSLLNPSDG